MGVGLPCPRPYLLGVCPATGSPELPAHQPLNPGGLLLRSAHLGRRPGQGVGLPGAGLAEGEDGAGEAAGGRGAAGPRQRAGVRARQQRKDSAGVRSIPGASLTRAAPAPLGAAHRTPGTPPPACTPRPALRRSGTLRLGPRLGGSPRGTGSGEGAGPAEGGVWAIWGKEGGVL